MNKKRKSTTFRLDDAKHLLKQIEKETFASAKKHLDHDWQENLTEILLTRIDILNLHKKDLAKIAPLLKQEPKQLPEFARCAYETIEKTLKLAKAPASPLHVLLFSALYTLIIESFMRDESKNLDKTMAAVDKNIKRFAEVSNLLCR